MSTVNDGGPAFPMAFQSLDRQGNPDSSPNVEWGMTLRDYFAAKALAGLLANPGGPIQYNEMHGWGFCNCEPSNVVGTAYGLADAMLAARANGKVTP